MSNVLIDKQKIDILANAISDKSGVPVTMTLDEMVEAVDGIETGGGEPNLQAKTYTIDSAGSETITADSGYDGLSEVEVSVPQADFSVSYGNSGFITENTVRKWKLETFAYAESGGWVDEGGYEGGVFKCNAVPSGTAVTPTTSAQTIGGANYMMEGAVTVSAMPTGTAGTPTATKGTVSNHQVSVTPSVTNTAGYISGGTKTGTAVTVSASELVSGTYTVDSSGTKDVTNYASASVPAGTAGTPSASKGAVSNHSISVTPSVTNTTGWITGSTKSGTAVTVTASELASGNKAITQNGTDIDVVGYSTVSVNVAGAEYTRTVIAPQQTVTPTSAMQQMTLTSTGLIEDAKSYIVTIDNVEWLTTCETLWSSNYCIGDVRYFLEASPSSTIYPFGAICENGVIYACFATTGSHTIKIERLDFVTGGTTLTTKNITTNGTYNASSDSADGYSSVTVNVPTGTSKNVQVLQSTSRTNSSSLTKVLGDLTVSKTGTYDIYWSGGRSNTSTGYTWGTRLYVDSSGYGTENTSWTNNCQNNHLSNVSLTVNQKLSVYARGRGGNYYAFAPMLVIVEA